MKNRMALVLMALLLVSCQVVPFSSVPDETFFSGAAGLRRPVRPQSDTTFGTTPLKEWYETPYKLQGDDLPVNLEMVENWEVAGDFTSAQTAFLSANGFAVLHTGDEQFSDIREQVSTRYGQPYYLTTDAAYHALHINFDALLKQLEKEVFKTEASEIISAMLDQVTEYASGLKGTPLEEDAYLAEAYLGVALKLFDDTTRLPGDLSKKIQPQLNQIQAGNGREKSVLIPGFEDDYGAYKPVGHYAGDPDLENYFRAMTWLGRVAFKFRDVENPQFKPSRTPLILTLALRETKTAHGPAIDRYLHLMDTLGYLIGPTDDGGPVETGTLMNSIYGRKLSIESLADDQNWQAFLSRVDALPRPKINSTFINTTIALNKERSWRLMGQRFTLDAMIFQNLIFDKVGTEAKKREFPSGLDVAAAFGSTAALEAQKKAGETGYENYPIQMEKLQNLLKNQPQKEWLSTFYSGWLYAFIPQLQTKGDAFPPLMTTSAWQNRELNSMLGSWAELKHDTALYTKMPEMMGGGGPPGSPSAPGYVEPNPNVFFRLAYIAGAIKEGLERRGYAQENQNWTESGNNLSFSDLWGGMGDLSEQFLHLGDIAVKELQGQKLTGDDFDVIQSPLGKVESKALYAQRTGQDAKQEPVPVIASVSGAGNSLLEAGVGKLDRLFVVVPINGKLQIAQGGVFTYYEFKQPRTNRLTDEEWRSRVNSNSPKLPAYTENYLLAGGKTKDILAFRIGDVYLITEKGGKPPLNLRDNPSKSANILDGLKKDTYLEITDGPKTSGGLQWWKVRVFGSEKEGWVAENQEWYERAHGQ